MKISPLLIFGLLLAGCATESHNVPLRPQLSNEAGVREQSNPLMEDYANIQKREQKRITDSYKRNT